MTHDHAGPQGTEGTQAAGGGQSRRESASPVCYADQADPGYMGYASDDELAAALGELLEAERAGARVADESCKQADQATDQALLAQVRHDEIRWCGMLIAAIKTLGAQPSSRVGAFYEKAMAIDDMPQRMAFLNRGQGWVVKRLQALVPRVRDAGLQDQLLAMLKAHRENIDQVNVRLERLGRR